MIKKNLEATLGSLNRRRTVGAVLPGWSELCRCLPHTWILWCGGGTVAHFTQDYSHTQVF